MAFFWLEAITSVHISLYQSTSVSHYYTYSAEKLCYKYFNKFITFSKYYLYLLESCASALKCIEYYARVPRDRFSVNESLCSALSGVLLTRGHHGRVRWHKSNFGSWCITPLKNANNEKAVSSDAFMASLFFRGLSPFTFIEYQSTSVYISPHQSGFYLSPRKE